MKRHLDIDMLDNIIRSLSRGEALPEKNKDHALTGDWVGYRECHILPDWLLVYRIEADVLVLTLVRTGTHSDLFGKQIADLTIFDVYRKRRNLEKVTPFNCLINDILVFLFSKCVFVIRNLADIVKNNIAYTLCVRNYRFLFTNGYNRTA